MTFRFAPQVEVQEYREEIEALLAAAASVADDPGILSALVTDQSALSDFRPTHFTTERWCDDLSDELGISIAPGNTGLVDVAKRLRHELRTKWLHR